MHTVTLTLHQNEIKIIIVIIIKKHIELIKKVTIDEECRNFFCDYCEKILSSKEDNERHCLTTQHTKIMMIEKNEIKMFDWPPKLNVENLMHCLKNFKNNTDFNLIKRYVCSVCSRFRLNNEVKLVECSIDQLNEYRSILSVDCLKLKDMNTFQFDPPFNPLNNMTLNKNGFNNQFKMVICFSCVIKLF